MKADSEKVEVSKNKGPSDLSPVLGQALGKVQVKLLFYMFIIFLILSSDVFVRRVLYYFKGATNEMGTATTTYGTIITGILLVIFVAIIDIMIKQKII